MLRNIILGGIIYIRPPFRQAGGVSGRFVLATPHTHILGNGLKLKMKCCPYWLGLVYPISAGCRVYDLVYIIPNTCYRCNSNIHSFWVNRLFVLAPYILAFIRIIGLIRVYIIPYIMVIYRKMQGLKLSCKRFNSTP